MIAPRPGFLAWRTAQSSHESFSSVVLEHGVDLPEAREFLSPVQEVELDENRDPGDLGAGLLDEFATRLHRSPCGQQVIHEQDPVSSHERVGVQFETVGPVLQVVVDPVDHARQLARFAYGHEPRGEGLGDRDAKDESPAFSTDYQIDPLAAVRVGHELDRQCEGTGIREQGGEIFEHHARLGKVGDLFDQGVELVVRFGAVHGPIIRVHGRAAD